MGDRDHQKDLTLRLFDDTPLEDFSPTLGECNLEEFPSFLMDRRDGDLRPRSYPIKTIDAGDGVALESEWTVIPSAEYGPLGPTDQDMFMAVQALIGRRGGLGSDGELEFSFTELGELLGWSRSGKNHRLMKESLLRLQQTTFRSRNAFYSAQAKSYVDDSFRVWDVTFSEIRGGRGKRSRHRLIFGGLFLQNWLSGYLKGVDVPLYRRLTGAVTRRLYRLIDVKTRNGLLWEEELVEVGRQIPLSDTRSPSRVSDRLKSAHEQLKEIGYLSEVRTRNGWVRYQVSPLFKYRRDIQEAVTDPKQVIAIERLMSERVRAETSLELVQEYGADICIGYADAVAFQEGVRNRAGWLVEAIKNNWSLNDGGCGPDTRALQRSVARDTVRESVQENQLFHSRDSALPHAPESHHRLHTPDPDPGALPVWDKILEDVSEEINAPSLRVWFEGTVPVSIAADTLTISVPNAFAKDYIESRFKDLLEGAVSKYLTPTPETSSPPSLNIVVEPSNSTHNTFKRDA